MSRLKTLSEGYKQLRARLEQGGGAERIKRQHDQGKLTARERVAALLDKDGPWVEIGLLVAWDQYDGQAPAAGVVTGLGRIGGRPVVVVANDATVKAGSWWPETIKKILRAQEIAMRQRIPIIYLVDSAGVNLPYQGGVFPGQYGAARIFYYNSIMRRYLKVPQIAAVMGPCIAGGAYLPALSDVIFMVDGTGGGCRNAGRCRDAYRDQCRCALPSQRRCGVPGPDPRVYHPASPRLTSRAPRARLEA